MDLDMIQDLLGGSNLPPPPSVQDLLGDVVPIPPSPSPPPDNTLSSFQLSAEHNYSKTPMDGTEEVMEHSNATSSPGSQTLLKLDTSTDCYEAFLLNLLKVYTQNKANTNSEADNTTATSTSQTSGAGTTEGGVFTIDSISPEAINALSQEQVQSLVTSNSMNYDVIHQILAYRQKVGGGDGVLGGAEVGTGEEKRGEENMSALQQLQALQLTPEQLKQIQLQMAELIRTKQIILPTELSLEQQQQLLQSLILKQVHSQHHQFLAPTPVQSTTSVGTSSVASSIVSTNPSTKTSSTESGNSTLVAMLRGSDSTQVHRESSSGEGEKTVKMEVPPPSNFTETAGSIPLQLSPNPVAEGSTEASSVTKRSGGRKKKDTNEPKKPTSPYGIFFSDVYPSVLQANPRMSFSEASKLIAAMWNAMGVDTKKQYHERTERQKEVYQSYLATHKEETPTTVAPTTPTEDESTTQSVSTGKAAATRTVQVEAMAALPTSLVDDGSMETDQTRKIQSQPHPPPHIPAQPRVVLKDVKHCINDGCFKDSVYSEFRGPRYCSNECVVQHCRSVFQEWVAQRKVAT